MRLVSMFATSLLLAATAVAATAVAEPATPEGAKALAAAYAAYVSQEAVDKGVVTITPQGDDYVISWDLEKALAALDAPAGVVKAAPFVYRITPTLNGGWLARASALPDIAFAPTGEGGRDGGTLGFEGFRFDGLYDPAAPDFFLGKLALSALKLDLKAKSLAGRRHIVVTQNGSAGDLRIRAGADTDSVDLSASQSTLSGGQKTARIGEDGAETPITAQQQGAATGADGAIGLRAKAIGELWRFLVARADKPAPTPEELKPLLAALPPLWRELSGRIDLDDVALAFPGGSLRLKSMAEEARMTGLAEHGSMALALAFRDAALDLDAGPEWMKQTSPASLALNLEAGVDGLDRAAKIALDDADFLKTGKPSDAARAEIAGVLMAGRPHVKLSETHFATPLIDATLEGEADFEANGPDAHAKVTADSLDKVVETLAKLTETEPGAQQWLYVATFARGLAKTADGRLVWDIDYVGPNAIKVNGQTFPPAQPE